MQDDLHRRMLIRSISLVGDEEALARYLNVSRTRVALWLIGAERPPLCIFLQLVDLLLKPDSATRAAPTSAPMKERAETTTPGVKTTL